MRIKNKYKVYQYFIQRWGAKPYRRGWLKGDCPSCGKEDKWGINISTNRTNCFVCGYNSNPIETIAYIENLLTSTEVISYLKDFEGVEYKEEEVKPYELLDNVRLPEGFKNIRRGDSLLGKAARSYVKRRGFNIQEVSRAGWGYCTTGDYIGYIIMPFYQEGKLVYFNARKYMFDGVKFNNPPVEEFGLGKSMLIYNVDSLHLYKKIWVTEGLMNARTIGDNAVSLGGKKYSNYQLNVLLKSSVEKFIIAFDNDGYDDAIRLALQLQPFKKVKVIYFEDDRDINDLGKRKVIKMSYKHKYLSYNQLLQIKNSI